MYPRRPEASVYEAFMDVLRVEDGLIADDRNVRQRSVRLVQAVEATPGRLTFRPEGAAAGVYRHIAG
jgi:hypothetical protein